MARGAGAARLVLTHLLPDSDVAASVAEATAAYGSAVDVAALHRTFAV